MHLGGYRCMPCMICTDEESFEADPDQCYNENHVVALAPHGGQWSSRNVCTYWRLGISYDIYSQHILHC
jgi:hypothetical protein